MQFTIVYKQFTLLTINIVSLLPSANLSFVDAQVDEGKHTGTMY
jgi:hypothetical protein